MNVNGLVSQMYEGEVFEYELFWKIDGNIGECSQWYTGNGFSDGSHHFISAEHYMMIGKAKLFNSNGINDNIIKRMLATKSPREVKSLGREVKGFDARTWDDHKFDLVVEGNYLKFSQDAKLKAMLLDTDDAILVEASPYDPIWGIGLAANHIDSRLPPNWKGLNLLGFALMQVRSKLQEQ